LPKTAIYNCQICRHFKFFNKKLELFDDFRDGSAERCRLGSGRLTGKEKRGRVLRGKIRGEVLPRKREQGADPGLPLWAERFSARLFERGLCVSPASASWRSIMIIGWRERSQIRSFSLPNNKFGSE
jgi:hypothetical protein